MQILVPRGSLLLCMSQLRNSRGLSISANDPFLRSDGDQRSATSIQLWMKCASECRFSKRVNLESGLTRPCTTPLPDAVRGDVIYGKLNEHLPGHYQGRTVPRIIASRHNRSYRLKEKRSDLNHSDNHVAVPNLLTRKSKLSGLESTCVWQISVISAKKWIIAGTHRHG